jgi:hypothetical protein
MAAHKWAKEIKAWADGAEIEFREYKRDKALDRYVWSNWNDNFFPEWLLTNVEYRIKPQPKEPQYLYVYQTKDGLPEFQILDFYIEHDLYRKYIGKIKLEQDDE